jgi:hypothetical protein
MELKGVGITRHRNKLFYQKKTNYLYRTDMNIKAYLRFEREITKLWELRGIKWD